MISFRFHLMSIVAVFLALALGVVVGSTYVDRAIVSSLENRIGTVSENLDEGLADNEQLAAEVSRLESYAAESAPYAVQGRLTDVPVVVVAERGVDGDQLTEMTVLLDRAGADAPGILWVEPAWALETESDREELDAVLDDVEVAPGLDAASALRARAWRAVVAELGPSDEAGIGEGEVPDGDDAEGGAAVTGTTEPDGTRPGPDGTLPGDTDAPANGDPSGEPEAGEAPTLEVLIEAGYFSFDGVGSDDTVLDLAGTGPRVLLVSRDDSEVGVEDLVGRLVDALIAGETDTVVAELGDEGTVDEADPVTSQVRDDADRRAAVATVDDLRLVSGQVAAVLALDELGEGQVGHYGYAPGADRPLPESASP